MLALAKKLKKFKKTWQRNRFLNVFLLNWFSI